MPITFKRATRENVILLIGLVGGTGSGKTYTGMRMASGICGKDPFAVIDTEAGRAKHYADQFIFDHADLKPPFSPDAYTEAIMAADKAGYKVILVDSASHEWAGEGGILDMQESELNRMAKDDWNKRESCKMASWIKPKVSHKKMVQRFLQVRAHIILCFRAEEKIEMIRNDKGKMEIVPKQSLTGLSGWIPICEKNLPFELTASILLLAEKPGIPNPIKLQEQHRHLFPLNKPITEESGRLIAEWAAGGITATPSTQQKEAPKQTEAPKSNDTFTANQKQEIQTLMKVAKLDAVSGPRFKAFFLGFIERETIDEPSAEFLINNFDNLHFIWTMAEAAKVDFADFKKFYLEFIEAPYMDEHNTNDLKENFESMLTSYRDTRGVSK